MGAISFILSQLSADDWLKLAPLLVELSEAYQNHSDKKAFASSMDSISRGAQYAIQTGNTDQLEKAILSHCGPDGCRVP
jgi:hypothetical protein